jgi:hypothetical protein
VGCLGLLSTGIWLGEVIWLKGWEGLRWLDGYPWAAPPTALAVSLGALVAGSGRTHTSWRRRGAFLIMVWAALWASFEVSRYSLFALHSRGFIMYLGTGSLSQKLDDVGVVMTVPFAVVLAS